MNLPQRMSDRVCKHEEKLREVYEMYSIGVDDLDTENHRTKSVEEHEMWFLACTLAGVPRSVCGIYIVSNYRNGNPIGFRTRRSPPIAYHREFRRFTNISYGAHMWDDVDSSRYREELEEEFDLRKTGNLGVAIIDMFDEDIIEIINLDDLYSVEEIYTNELITSRNLIFEVGSTSELLCEFDTGLWSDSRFIGPNEAQQNGWFWSLRKNIAHPHESGVEFAHKNKLRQRKSWGE